MYFLTLLPISNLCDHFIKLGDIDSFPLITDKHKSLACKAMKANPELYTKYANVKTPMGFTFDQAIQVIKLNNRHAMLVFKLIK